MTARDFCFWLQGYFELHKVANGDHSSLTIAQAKTIERHLAMVFVHEIDPSMGDADKQAQLNAIHKPGKSETVMRC